MAYNPQKARQQKLAHRKANLERILEQERAYRIANRDKKREYDRDYREKNLEKLRERHRIYRRVNRDRKSEYDRDYREKNLEKLRERRRSYYAKNGEKIREYNRARTKVNPDYHKQRQDVHRKKFLDIPAPHSGRRWSPAEDVIVMREDISRIEMCYMLGRTYEAVCTRQKRLRKMVSA